MHTDAYSGKDMMRAALRTNRWSLLSIAIAVGGAIVIRASVSYLYSRGLWEGDSKLQSLLRSCGEVVLALSVVAAMIGLVRDKSVTCRIVALLLSALSVVFYVR
jgi:hypothetical protein